MNALSVGLPILRAEIDILEKAMTFASSECGLKTIDVSVGCQANG